MGASLRNARAGYALAFAAGKAHAALANDRVVAIWE
jgi:hypothetical protein